MKESHFSSHRLLKASLLVNALFILHWFFSNFIFTTNRIGILTEDVKAGYFASDSTFIFIPKGTQVKDISPRGIGRIGQFEPNRFEIIITSDRNIVDYSDLGDKKYEYEFSNLYSADN